MKILFYSSIREAAGMEIAERLKALATGDGLSVYRSIEALSYGLQRLYEHDPIVILRARDRKELLRIVSLRDLLQGLRIILLVPNREKETISLAHRLRPRFLSNSENDLSDTMSVLQKMIEHGENKF
jgi:hypothetical protein